VDEESLRNAIKALIADERLNELRVDTCKKVEKALSAAAEYLALTSAFGESRGVRGLALVVDMSAEMVRGTIDLYGSESWYAGTALVRQIVETEYLLTLFGQEPDSASAWLDASAKELRKWWNPAAIRERTGGSFLEREYWDHCERGGHPVPSAKPLLKNAPIAFDRRFCWIDFTVHAKRLFFAMKHCFRTFGFSARLGEEVYIQAAAAVSEWSGDDPAPALLARVPRVERQ
jgi:hypothetical protein